MMRLGTRSILLGALAAMGLVSTSCACEEPPTTGQAPSIRLDLQEDPTKLADYLVDFGVVTVGDRKAKVVDVGNDGNTELILKAAALEEPFSHTIPENGVVVGVGGKRPFVFAFEPTEETDEPSETILSLQTNEGGGRQFTVRLVGQSRQPYLRCAPSELDFGSVPKRSTKTLSVECSNPLTIPVEIGSHRFRGNHAQSFDARVPDAGTGVGIPSGGSVTVEVDFRSASVGRNDATLELNDGFGQLLARVPIVATSVESALVVEPSTCLDFAYVQIGESASRSLKVHAIGDQSLRIEGIAVPEAGKKSFTVHSFAPMELNADGTPREIVVEFHPLEAGAHQSTIEIVHTAPGGETLRTHACVKGFGGGPALACDRNSLDFGMVAVGVPVKSGYTCFNAGTSDLDGVPVDPLVITDVRSSSPEFKVRIVDPTTGAAGPKRGGYKAGDFFFVEVRYSPTEERFDSSVISIETASTPGGVHETPVSGQGRILPPCEFTLEPPNLRFGIVERGDSKTLPFGIRNELGTSCLINGLRLEEGSDPAFSMDPINSIELGGYETLSVPVIFSPTEYRASFTGAVVFQISNPDRSEQRVELFGVSARVCLEIEPKVLDFGVVMPGCQTQEVHLTVSNACGIPATIESVEIGRGIDSDVFQIVSRPVFPRTLQLHERIEMTLIFAPEKLGTFQGSIRVNVEDSEPYVSNLVGGAVAVPIQTDTFDQKARPRVDILWVIDNSGSFGTYQQRISQNLPAFLSKAEEQGIDYRIAVTSSGLDETPSCTRAGKGGEDGRFFPIDGSHPRILTPTTPDLEKHWEHNVKVGTCHGTEEYFEAARRALSEPLINETKSSKHAHKSAYDDGNAGFLRREAFLSVIFVADEREQSSKFGTVSQYLAFFQSIKNKDMFRAHGIVGDRSGRPRKCSVQEGDAFHELIDATGGTWLDICTDTNRTADWTEGLKKMSEGAFGVRAHFELRGSPGDRNGDGKVDEDDIELSVNRISQPPRTTNTRQPVWTYDPVARSIIFTPLFLPKPGSQITATYQVACH